MAITAIQYGCMFTPDDPFANCEKRPLSKEEEAFFNDLKKKCSDIGYCRFEYDYRPSNQKAGKFCECSYGIFELDLRDGEFEVSDTLTSKKYADSLAKAIFKNILTDSIRFYTNSINIRLINYRENKETHETWTDRLSIQYLKTDLEKYYGERLVSAKKELKTVKIKKVDELVSSYLRY